MGWCRWTWWNGWSKWLPISIQKMSQIQTWKWSQQHVLLNGLFLLQSIVSILMLRNGLIWDTLFTCWRLTTFPSKNVRVFLFRLSDVIWPPILFRKKGPDQHFWVVCYIEFVCRLCIWLVATVTCRMESEKRERYMHIYWDEFKSNCCCSYQSHGTCSANWLSLEKHPENNRPCQMGICFWRLGGDFQRQWKVLTL